MSWRYVVLLWFAFLPWLLYQLAVTPGERWSQTAERVGIGFVIFWWGVAMGVQWPRVQRWREKE